jgi:hypothetical protein
MTADTDPDEAVVALPVEAARAAIAVGLAKRAGLSIAAPGTVATTSRQLTLSPYPLGYQLESELMVLERITQPTAPDTAPDSSPGGLTSADLLVSETAAFLFDKLVNPVLPLQRVSPEVGDLVPLNGVYEEVLRHARFAGSVRVTSLAYLKAAAVLYVDDDRGGRTETAAYREYLDFERKAREAQDAVDLAAAGGADRAIKERERVLAEWSVRGHRREIDEAIRVILQEELAAGFEDERKQLIERLGAGRRGRVDAPGFSYFPAQLVPIRPLLDPGAAPSGWTVVDIGPSELRALLANADLPVPIPEGSIERALEGFRRLTFEFLVCDVVREWLNEALFEARFWRLRRKLPELAQALTGHFDANHARLARSMLRRLDLVEQALAELDAVIVDACQPWQHQIELLQTNPGVGPKVAQVIVAETGADMARFPTAAHLAAWAGLAPAMHESAGHQTPAGKRHGNKWLAATLVEAVGSVGRMHGKNYLAARHARLLKRRGMGRAQVAVAHSILVAAYWMLKRDEPYHDLGADWHTRRNDEAHTRRLVAQLEHLGHTVIINPAARSTIPARASSHPPDAAPACPVVQYSRVCVRLRSSSRCAG